MNVLDLFSGIGGFSLGLERAGMQTIAFCEIEPYARAVLAKHWPGVKILENVETADFPPADVITAGFPCQDISFAGEGAGLAGARSGLYRHVIRALRLVRPKIAVLENVAALLSRGLGTVLGDMAEVGYDAEWHCIPASAVGAPHRRDRIWIIANARGEQHEGRRAPLSGALAAELSRANANAHGCERGQEQDRKSQQSKLETSRRGDAERFCSDASDTDSAGLSQRRWQEPGGARSEEWAIACRNYGWISEPDVGRVAHGVPARVDRLKGLGNAVVPQIPEIIGRAIMRSIA